MLSAELKGYLHRWHDIKQECNNSSHGTYDSRNQNVVDLACAEIPFLKKKKDDDFERYNYKLDVRAAKKVAKSDIELWLIYKWWGSWDQKNNFKDRLKEIEEMTSMDVGDDDEEYGKVDPRLYETFDFDNPDVLYFMEHHELYYLPPDHMLHKKFQSAFMHHVNEYLNGGKYQPLSQWSCYTVDAVKDAEDPAQVFYKLKECGYVSGYHKNQLIEAVIERKLENGDLVDEEWRKMLVPGSSLWSKIPIDLKYLESLPPVKRLKFLSVVEGDVNCSYEEIKRLLFPVTNNEKHKDRVASTLEKFKYGSNISNQLEVTASKLMEKPNLLDNTSYTFNEISLSVFVKFLMEHVDNAEELVLKFIVGRVNEMSSSQRRWTMDTIRSYIKED